jgi:hypothetical protein
MKKKLDKKKRRQHVTDESHAAFSKGSNCRRPYDKKEPGKGEGEKKYTTVRQRCTDTRE